MSLIKKIIKSIDASIDDFCSTIATKFDLDKDELMKLWHENGGSKKSKTVKKRSAYVNYSAHIRSVILEETPRLALERSPRRPPNAGSSYLTRKGSNTSPRITSL